nr:retrovirus-related Pol polyprotein from transposon TNT 1-94 [Tanacetum cinerariifolium]
MFRINPFKNSRDEKHVPNTVRASDKKNPINVSQPPVITKKDVNSDVNGLSSIGVENTKTRRSQPRSNTKHDRAKVSFKENQMKYQPKVTKPKKVGFLERLATPKPRKPRFLLRWSPTGRLFDQKGNIVDSSKFKSQSDCSNGNLKLLINFVWKFMGTVRFENDHVAAILGFGDLQWGNILITKVYFVEGLGHNLFSAGQFCDLDLEVAFRRNACFVRNLEGIDLLKGDRSTNLYTINLHEMASASPICLMARASSTKSWLWHQRLSHLNFNTINDLARNDLVSGLPKFKYHKEHLCPSYEQGNSKRASHPLKPVPNSRQRLHLIYMDLCGLMRIASINGKRKPDISFLHVFGALCYPKNDRKDIGKLGAKGNIGFFIGYSADSCTYRIYNQRIKKIMETMNVSFNELSMTAFEQRSSKPEIQSMTSGQISSGLDLTYAPSTITTQQPTEGELDLLFEAVGNYKLSLPEDHMADFHYLDDDREIWLAVKARFGGNEESKKIRKTMLKQEFLEFNVSEEEGLHKGYDRINSDKTSREAKKVPNTVRGCSKHMTGNLKLLINFVWKFMGTVRFENDRVAAILGFGDLQWGNILITRVYFVEGLGHNLFSVGQFYDSDLEVAFRRHACFVRNLEGVDLLIGDRSTKLYTINLHEMTSASPICLMARASSTKSWLWHQRLSHLNFDTINDLARNDLVAGLPKFKYHKEHLCPSCEQGKSKRASHLPKPVPNSRQRLHLLHMDLCGPMRSASINGKRDVLVIVDDYSRYT